MTSAHRTDEHLRIERGMMAQHTISIAEIVRDTALQPRAQLDSGTIQEYADAIKSGAEFPPVDVWETPEGMLLSSGFHRVAAYETAGKKKVPAEIHQGTRRDAIWHALGENKTHGLKRTNADKRRAVELALSDPEWVKWSSRKIADHVGVSHFTVDSIRNDQLAESASSQPTTRIGSDGKERKLPTRSDVPANGTVTDGGTTYHSPVSVEDDHDYFDSDFSQVDDAPLDDVTESETDTDIEEEDDKSIIVDDMHPWAKEIFTDLSEFEKIRRDINDLQKRVKALASERKGIWIHAQTVCSDLANAKRGVSQCRPFAACPYCKGKGCLPCRKSGHVTRAMYERTPAEKKI